MRFSILLVLVLFVGQASAEEGAGAASMLVALQNDNGSWGDPSLGPESQVYTTAKALEGLMYYGGEKGAVESGLDWIVRQGPEDTACLSELSRVLYLSGESAEQELLTLGEYQNPDGGWGKAGGSGSTPWYTCNAITAMAPFEDYRDAAAAGGEFLLMAQGAEGDFDESSMITSGCVYSLVLLFNATGRDDFGLSAVKGYRWLNKTAGEDGVLEGVSSTGSSTVALQALYGVTKSDDLKGSTDRAKEWIANSTGNLTDPLHTAWALIALTGTTSVSPAKPRASINASFRDYALPLEIVELDIKLENRGLRDLKNVTLFLTIPEGLHIEMEDTKWEVEGLEMGSGIEFVENVTVGAGVEEGEYPMRISGNGANSTVVLRVMKSPLEFEMVVAELDNGEPFNFEMLVKNTGGEDISILGVAADVDEEIRDVVPKNVQMKLPANSAKSMHIFSAVAPENSGEYYGGITIGFLHPTLGERHISIKQRFLVGGTIPSGILKLLLYGTLILSIILLFNLLAGYDLQR